MRWTKTRKKVMSEDLGVPAPHGTATPSDKAPAAKPDKFVPQWSGQPGFHERRLIVRHNNAFFPLDRRSVSEHELSSAKDMDEKMFRSFEESARLIFCLQRGDNIDFDKADKLHKETEETLNLGSGLGPRACVLLPVLKAGCDVLGRKLRRR